MILYNPIILLSQCPNSHSIAMVPHTKKEGNMVDLEREREHEW